MDEMIPVLLDVKSLSGYKKLKIIDDYISFIWTERYYTPGDFELVMPITLQNLSLFQRGRYITRPDREEWGVIEKIRLEKVLRIGDASDQMVISGRMVSSFIARRIVGVQQNIDDTIPNCVEELLNKNAISPARAGRYIDDLTFDNQVTSVTEIKQQFFGENLLEAIQGVVQNSGIGFKMIPDGSDGWKFVLYEGLDRTAGQNVNDKAIFSSEMDNLEAAEYEIDYSTYKNSILTAGEGEGDARTVVWYEEPGALTSNLDRYEGYKDGSSISTNNGEIGQTLYEYMLQQAGAEEATTFTEAFAGSVDLSLLEYKQDFDIGDKVTVISPGWGISADFRLVEMIESTDESGMHTFTPSFDS